MNKKTILLSGGILAFAVVFAFSLFSGESTNTSSSESGLLAGKKVTLYKSPSCGCCGVYAAYLRRKGYEVEEVRTNDMESIKQKFGIPYNMQSCHTVDFGDYFVEGHVPVEAINELLTSRPDVLGIAMPGMPAGSPGMGGAKKGPFEVFSVGEGGETAPFLSL